MSEKIATTAPQLNPLQKRGFKIRFSRKWFALPLLLFVLFFVVTPLIILLVNAFLTEDGSFTFQYFIEIFTNQGNYLTTFGITILVAFGTTVLCLLIAYPVAYFLARGKLFKNPYTIVLLFVLPMWINFLLRIVALKEFLNNMIGIPFGWTLIMIGMVYDFLPFMVLPLYNSISKMDQSLIEAATDLGANKAQVFFKTIIPLSMPGVISGITMVFIPAMSAYAVSDVLSGQTLSTLGGTIANHLADTGLSATFAIIMSMLMVGFIMLTSRYDRIGDSKGGSLL